MSISTLESSQSRRMLDELCAEQNAREVEVRSLTDEFARAVAGDLTRPALFARSIRVSGPTTSRYQTVAEVMDSTLDYRDFSLRALQVLARAAQGLGTQRDAAQLLKEMGELFADMEATS